jgi:hypothetical protein
MDGAAAGERGDGEMAIAAVAPYGIGPKTIWIGEESAKGYVEDFIETFRRYIPKSVAKAPLEEWHAAAKDKPASPKPEWSKPDRKVEG